MKESRCGALGVICPPAQMAFAGGFAAHDTQISPAWYEYSSKEIYPKEHQPWWWWWLVGNVSLASPSSH